MKYRKKPVVIEAMQYTGTKDNLAEMGRFVGDKVLVSWNKLVIDTLEGVMTASIGDYIIKGIHGEFYPCKPDIFEKTYDKVED